MIKSNYQVEPKLLTRLAGLSSNFIESSINRLNSISNSNNNINNNINNNSNLNKLNDQFVSSSNTPITNGKRKSFITFINLRNY